jgi:hypothetical protein
MSRKNRAFALTVATAALVGLSAPVAGAATLQGPSGFNNDSILNLSNNQLSTEACNLGIPVNALLAQIPLTGLGLVGDGMLNSTTLSPTTSQTCTQTPGQGNTSTTNTNSSNASSASTSTSIHHVFWRRHHHHSGSVTTINTPADNGPSGFNGDSVLNVSNNQVTEATCNAAIPISEVGLQLPVTLIGAVLGSGALNSTALDPSTTQACTQTPGQGNSSTFNTNSNNGNNG